MSLFQGCPLREFPLYLSYLQKEAADSDADSTASDEYHPSSGDDEEVEASDSDEDYTSISEASASGGGHVTAGTAVCAISISVFIKDGMVDGGKLRL